MVKRKNKLDVHVYCLNLDEYFTINIDCINLNNTERAQKLTEMLLGALLIDYKLVDVNEVYN